MFLGSKRAITAAADNCYKHQSDTKASNPQCTSTQCHNCMRLFVFACHFTASMFLCCRFYWTVLSSHNSSALSTLSYCLLRSAASCLCITMHIWRLFPSASCSVMGPHLVPSCGKHKLCEGWKRRVGCYCPLGICCKWMQSIDNLWTLVLCSQVRCNCGCFV